MALIRSICLSLLVMVNVSVETREIFSPVQDIIKITTTDRMATFELHCWHTVNNTNCRFLLIDDEQKTKQSDIQLEPKRNYQRYSFDNLEPNHWYRITKMIDNNLIESGRFRTRMSIPPVPQIDELFCLNQEELLVRWSISTVVNQQGLNYSFQIEWWPNNRPNHLSSTIVTILNVTTNLIDPYAVIIRNLSNENYRLRIQSHLFDLEDLSSDFSSNQQFNCINNNDDEITINFMELIGFISFIFISIFAIVILLSLIWWYRYSDHHHHRSIRQYDLEQFHKQQFPLDEQ
ncbi:uncharacterized protein LOC113794574 [Dermatophagoides pteronyssinus]|uniref:uncharacterized protein LOC113794574 n=1 Tax=Dermatophagoides pteronyssinus TaxID=6956 RepID=UPI003F66FF76